MSKQLLSVAPPTHVPLIDWQRLKIATSDEAAALAQLQKAEISAVLASPELAAVMQARQRYLESQQARATVGKTTWDRYGLAPDDQVTDAGDEGGLIVRPAKN